MAGDLAVRSRRRDVPEFQWREAAACGLDSVGARCLRVVVSADPYPPAAIGDFAERSLGLGRERARQGVIEAVAEAKHGFGLRFLRVRRQAAERFHRFVRRQQAPARAGHPLRFPQMEIRDREQPPPRPMQRAAAESAQPFAAKGEFQMRHRRLRGRPRRSGLPDQARLPDPGFRLLLNEALFAAALDRHAADFQQ